MSLKDLNEAIYQRDFRSPKLGDADNSSHNSEIVSEPHKHVTPSGSVWTDTSTTSSLSEDPRERQKIRQNRRRKIILSVALGALFLFVLIGLAGKRLFFFDAANINFEITGPEIAKTGDEITLTMKYRNGNWSSLSNAEFSVVFPESFKPRAADGWKVALSRATYTLPTIPGRSSGQLSLTGTLQAFEKKTAFFKGILRSSPKGITNPTEIVSQWTTVVDASSIKLEVVGPPSITLGQSLEYLVKYQNESAESIDNVQLFIEYPEGFTPTSFDPRPTRGENRWLLGRLDPQAEGAVSIKGEIRGNAGDARRLIARVGKEQGNDEFLSLAQEEKLTKVSSPPLSVTLDMNSGSSVDPGQFLAGRIIFRNNSNVGIRDIIATVKLDEMYLNMAQLSVPKGVNYDRSKQQLIFRASEIPELRNLEPGEQGEVLFGIKVRPDLFILGKRNIEIKTKVSLDSPDLPHGQNTEAFLPQSESIIRINSLAKPLVQVEYNDLQFPNTGPLPPQVGEITTYTVRLTAETDLNTLNDTRWTMTLPSTVQFRSILLGDEKTLKYNGRTGELTWEVGSLEPGTNGAQQVIFQIGFTPAPGGSDLMPNLVNKGFFMAKDSFTGKKIEMSVPHVVAGQIIE